MRPPLILIVALLGMGCGSKPNTDASPPAGTPGARLAVSDAQLELEEFKREIRAELPAVEGIAVEELSLRLKRGEQPLLLDVRTEGEYAVSHLPGARRAETLDAALEQLEGQPKDRELVVYCSIGYRSAHLAEALGEAGYTQVLNLEGSIFEWANTGHAVYRGEEAVQQVHPYDKTWGRLLDREHWSEIE